MSPRLFAGFSADLTPEPDLADMVAAVAQATIPGPYVLHGHPAVHAFVVVEAGGLWWRLDGKSPRAGWSPWWTPKDSTRVGLWELMLQPDSLAKGIHKARQLDGTPYDYPALVAQLFRCLARKTWLPGARICTSIQCDVLTACDEAPAGVVASLPDLQPERLCRAFHAREGEWWTRREC